MVVVVILALIVVGFVILKWRVDRLARETQTKYPPLGKFVDHNAFAPDRPTPHDYLDVFARVWLRPRHAKAAVADLAYGGEHTPQMIARYSQIRVPFVVVQGEADRNVRVAMSQHLQRSVPGAQLLVLPDTGHELMFNRPAEVVAAIDRVWAIASHAE